MRLKEKNQPKFSDFIPVAHVEKHGEIISMDALLLRDIRKYMITLGTQEYVDDLRKADHKLMIQDTLYDIGWKRVFVVDSFKDIPGIRNKLLNIPFEDISKYLIFQESKGK